MKVTFKNLGRRNTRFSVEMKKLTYNNLYKAVKGCLMSRGTDFDYNDETRKGSVWVGGFRCVGEFEVEEKQNEISFN